MMHPFHLNACIDYEKKVEMDMVNHSYNNKKNKQAPQTIQCKKYPRHMCLGQAQIWCGIKPINEISTLPLMIVESPKTIQI